MILSGVMSRLLDLEFHPNLLTDKWDIFEDTYISPAERELPI